MGLFLISNMVKQQQYGKNDLLCNFIAKGFPN